QSFTPVDRSSATSSPRPPPTMRAPSTTTWFAPASGYVQAGFPVAASSATMPAFALAASPRVSLSGAPIQSPSWYSPVPLTDRVLHAVAASDVQRLPFDRGRGQHGAVGLEDPCRPASEAAAHLAVARPHVEPGLGAVEQRRGRLRGRERQLPLRNDVLHLAHEERRIVQARPARWPRAM